MILDRLEFSTHSRFNPMILDRLEFSTHSRFNPMILGRLEFSTHSRFNPMILDKLEFTTHSRFNPIILDKPESNSWQILSDIGQVRVDIMADRFVNGGKYCCNHKILWRQSTQNIR